MRSDAISTSRFCDGSADSAKLDGLQLADLKMFSVRVAPWCELLLKDF